MIVTRSFDTYYVGEVLTDAEVADQQRRGNLPDLIRNGYLKDDGSTEPSFDVELTELYVLHLDVNTLSVKQLRAVVDFLNISIGGTNPESYKQAIKVWQDENGEEEGANEDPSETVVKFRSDMKLAELKKFAKDNGIEVEGTKKVDYLTAIELWQSTTATSL